MNERPFASRTCTFAPRTPSPGAAFTSGKTVPAIVYRRRLHVVNLFVLPSASGRQRDFSKDGFAVEEWSSNGLRYVAVSDIPAGELRQFETLFVKRAG